MLTELLLSHFRSHERSAFRFDGRPVAIHGPNGAGKTNILEAISLLSPGRGLRRAVPEDLVRAPAGIGWKIAASLNGHEVETSALPGTPRSVMIDDKTAPQAALARVARILWLVPTMDRLWVEGADGRRRFLDRMTLSFHPAHAEATLAYEKAMRERNRLLKDGVRDPVWYDALEQQLAENGAVISANRRTVLSRVTAAQGDGSADFPAAALALIGPDGEAPTEAAADLLAAFRDGRARDMAAGRTLTGPHRADLTALYAAKNIPAAQSSTGEQKALLISLILANARALRDDLGHAPVLLLDEVAAHLDAGRRAALYDRIEELGAQAFMTGTGPELFEAMGDRGTRLAVSEAGGKSVVRVEGEP